MTLEPETTGRTATDADRELRRLARLGSLLEMSPHCAVVHSGGVLRWANRAAAALVGLEPDDVVGRNLLDWIAPEHHAQAIGRSEGVLRDGSTRSASETTLVVGSRRVVVETRAARTTWEGEPAVHVVLWDVTCRRAEHDQLSWDATHDELTGLLNRSGILSILGEALRESSGGGPVRVVMLDLDGFKTVNDRLGHSTGDRVLARVGGRLAEICDPHPVGRLGGDEFLVVLGDPATDQSGFAERLVEGIATGVAGPYGSTLRIGASVGCASGVPGTTSISELLGSADAAMYRAKRAGRRSPPRLPPPP